jgi:hypothetical protein
LPHHELAEQIRAAANSDDIQRLEEELAQFILGQQMPKI